MRKTRLSMNQALCRSLRFLYLGLVLLVAACTNAPASSPGSPTIATGEAPPSPITAYHGHTSTVFAVAWSPDGTRIASSGNDSTVQVWDAASGHLLLTYNGHTSGVRTLAWSPDGTRIVSGGNDNTIQVWNATTGKRDVVYTGHLGSIWAVAWSPDGRRIASGGNDGTVQVWEAFSGHRLLTYNGHRAPVRGVAWSPDGTRIVSASQDGTIHVWEATSGKPFFRSGSPSIPEWTVAWSPSGRCLAGGSGNTSEEQRREIVQVWSATSGQLLISYPVPSSAFLAYADGTLSLAWSLGSTRLASGGADTIVHLWKAPALCQG